MKKYLLISLLVVILILPITGATTIVKNEPKTFNILNEEYTHTVFVELGETTTCPYCVKASDQLLSIYNSGDLDFNYVSLVWDEGNSRVKNRLNNLGVTYIPDVFFDGKFKHMVGAQSTENTYRNAINQSGNRIVPDIDIDMDIEWKGGGTIKIIVNVQNNEQEKYNGHLRVYIAEKVSRWNDNSNKPFHYAVLDIPVDKNIHVIARGLPRPLADTTTFVKTWYGALFGFSDITKDNVVVIATLFDADTDYVVESAMEEPISFANNLFMHNNFIEKLVNLFSFLE